MEENMRFLKPYLRGLPLILLAMVISYLASSKYLNYVTPMYESTAKIRLADTQDGVPNSNLFKDLDVFASSNKMAAEIELLKSEVLISKVLDSIDFQTEIYRVGKIQAVELYDKSPILISIQNADNALFDKSFDLIIDSHNHIQIKSGGINLLDGHLGDTLKLYNSNIYISLNTVLLKDFPYLTIADNYRFKFLSRGTQIGMVQKNLDISPVDKDVPVIRITYKSQNAKKAEVLVNKLAEAYIQDYINTKYMAARVTVSFLDNQITKASEKVSEIENQIQNYRDDKNITNIAQETETDLRKISQLKIQQTNLKMSLDAIRDLEQYIKSGKKDFLELAPNFEAFNDLLSTEIVKKIKTLQSDKRDLMLVFTVSDERVKVVDKKIEDLTSYLIESITNTRKNLEVKYNQLSNDITESQKVFITVPEKERQMTIMNREFGIYQQSYNFLNEKKIEAQIAQAAKIAFHRIITKAKVTKEPVSPNRSIIKIVATLLGMLGALFLIFVIHSLKAKVNDKESIETNSMIGIALLTPKLDNKEELTNHFINAVTQLELKGLLPSERIVNFSAFNRKEGSIFNGYEVAKILALQERKVLIIDVCNKLHLTQKSAGIIEKLSDNLSVTHLDSTDFVMYSKVKLNQFITTLTNGFENIIVLNDEIGSQFSLLFMDMAAVNFVVLDSRLTPVKRVLEVDILKHEYNFTNLHFILNRYAYNPSVIKELRFFLQKTLKLIRS